MADRRMVKPIPIMMFIALSMAYFFVYVHRTTNGAVSEILQEHYAIGASSVALLASVYLYAYMLMQIPSGLLTDRFGPRRCATIFVLLIGLGSMLNAYSAACGDFNMMVVGRFIIGIGAAVVVIPMLKLFSTWFRRDQISTLNGIFILIGNVGAISAAVPLVIMMDSIGIATTYALLSLITFFIAGLCWLVIHDRPEGECPEPEDVERPPTLVALRTVFSSGRKFWPVAISQFFAYGSLMVWQASQAGSFYCSVYGLSITDAGWLVSMVGVGAIVGFPLAGYLSDKVLRSRKKVLVIGGVLYLLVWLVVFSMTVTKGLNDMVAQSTINVMMGFSAGFNVATFAQVNEHFPKGIAATSSACLNFFSFAGGSLLVTLSSFIVVDKTQEEYLLLWSIMLVMVVLAAIVNFFSVEKKM